MSSVRVQHDVYAQVLVNHVYDADVLPRIKANTGNDQLLITVLLNLHFFRLDEYATYIRLIDEMLDQRYNYVLQSRRTIETFPVGIFSRLFYCSSHFVSLFSMPLLSIHCLILSLTLNDNYIVK
jgi:hypothetical protein